MNKQYNPQCLLSCMPGMPGSHARRLDAISEADFETAEVKLKEAQTKITEAHKVQTDAIQGETRGDESEYSLLFAHAQDTLMTIYSEINIAKQLLKIFSAYEKRISALEK